jgi:hypothetical protein
MSNRRSHKVILPLLAVLALSFGYQTEAQAQIRIAPIQPEQVGDAINCYTGGNREVLTPDRSLIQSTSLAFAPNNVETQRLFDEVARHTDLRINVHTVPVTNAINVQICPSDGGRNFIAYSPTWLQKVYDETQNRWALYAVIVHEIGHYVLNHDRMSVGSEPHLELAADQYAGETLARMGASPADAQAAYHSSIMRSVVSHTHPPIEQRVAAVERGWRRVAATRPGVGSPSPRPSLPASSQPKIGVPCTTTDGRRYRC